MRRNQHADNGNFTFAFCTVSCLDALVDVFIMVCGLMKRSERILCESLLKVPDLRNILSSASSIVIYQRISSSCPSLQGNNSSYSVPSVPAFLSFPVSVCKNVRRGRECHLKPLQVVIFCP